MKAEIIAALISLAGVFISGLMSWFISRSSASKEVSKMQMQWKREDIVSSDDEFSEMVAAVARFSQTPNPALQSDAAAKAAAVRSKESGNLAVKLDHLYHCIYTGNVFFINEALDEVINEKRYRKSAQNATSRN